MEKVDSEFLMTKRDARKLAYKFYRRNIRNREYCSQARMNFEVKRLHQVFDVIEYFHGKQWTADVYKAAMARALGVA